MKDGGREQYHKDLTYLCGIKPKGFVERVLHCISQVYNASKYDTPEKARTEVGRREQRLENWKAEQPQSADEIRLVSAPKWLIEGVARYHNVRKLKTD